MIDSHCHLDDALFSGRQVQVLAAARAVGVNAFIVPAIERNNFQAVLRLCQHHIGCYPALGIHPLFVSQASQEDLTSLRNNLQLNQVVAVGEIGLDFYESSVNAEQQRFFFAAQLQLAQDFNLPVLLHCRRAYDDLIQMLQANGHHKGIVHAFNGSRQQADRLLAMGFKLGLGGAITHQRAKKLRNLATELPLSALVLETDSPEMRPSFLQKVEINQPKHIAAIARTLAELRGVSLAEVARACTENTLQVLRLTASN